MPRSRRPMLVFSFVIVSLMAVTSCAVQQRQLKSNALDFLYPTQADAIPPADVELNLPVRVGVAFAPPRSAGPDPFAETQKQALLERIAVTFRDKKSIGSVEVIPSSFLTPKGGFDNVDRLATAFGIDLIALVAYDQFQFSESGRSSWSYWTIVGAYVIKGEKNQTRTVMNTVVYDIPSRAMLFNSTGQSEVSGKSLPIQIDKALRERSEQGFNEATDSLIVDLEVALGEFQVQAASGTVRGPGTPAIAMYDESGHPVNSGDGGAGALTYAGAASLALFLSLVMLTGRKREA